MSTIHDEVKELLAKAKCSWDFKSISAELEAAAEKIQKDGTLLDLDKRRFNAAITAASRTIIERKKSPAHLKEALLSFGNGDGTLAEQQASQLATWFFGVAYSGVAITPEIERLIRPILAKTQSNQGQNKADYTKSFERYRRASDWGTDLVLSENNIRGLMVALRVVLLPAGFAEEMKPKCEQALNNLQTRKALSPVELVNDSLGKCKRLIEATWVKYSRGERCYLEQQDTFVLNICLTGLLDKVSQTEEIADAAQEITEQINLLRSHFQQVRFLSSTTLLARIKQEIQSLEQKLATTINFDALKAEAEDLQSYIRESKHGVKGVNFLDKYHVPEALAAANDLWEKISQKEHNPNEFNNELARFEGEILELERQSAFLTANPLKRHNARVKKDAPLSRWVTACFHSPADRNKAWGRIDEIHARLRKLWTRMEGQQEQRAADFQEQCVQFEAQIRASVNLRQTLSEIWELERCVDDFTKEKQLELRRVIKGLFKTFRERAADTAALQQLLQGVLNDVDRAHRRIFATTDFDILNTRAMSAKEWTLLRDFPAAEFDRMAIQVRRCFAEIRRLRFRQEKMMAERQARASEFAEELQQEINEAASANPASPDTWQTFGDLDRRLRESWHWLPEEQRRALKTKIDAGFQKIKAARAAFAAESAKVFAECNDVLSDILFALEEEATRDAAVEAIERIKPIRLQLRTESRLLWNQRQELNGILNAISSSINEVFEKASTQAVQEYNRLKADMEEMEKKIKSAAKWQSANALIDAHKALSAQIRDADLSIFARKECRGEMDRLWDDISERLQAFRHTRTQTEDLDSLLGRLERQGYLLTVDSVPSIG
jgi:hypothetical protein